MAKYDEGAREQTDRASGRSGQYESTGRRGDRAGGRRTISKDTETGRSIIHDHMRTHVRSSHFKDILRKDAE